MNEDEDQLVKKFVKEIEEKGAASARVSDGNIFFFSRNTLLDLLDAMDDKGVDYGSILVKRPESDHSLN